jgi:hypothetical protein
VVRRLALCGVLTSALAFSGCGKSELQKFADRLSPLDQEAAQEKAQLAATLRTVRLRNKDDARMLKQEISALAATQARIARLGGPQEVKPLLARYAQAGNAEIAVLNRFAAAVEAGDRSQLTPLAAQTQDAEGAVRRASDALHATLNGK